jgi:DNA-binding transcriptional LysR family regulator
MQEAEPAEAAEHLRSGDADLALVYDHAAMPVLAPDLELVHLLDDPYEAILPADHPLAKRRRVALEQLSEEPWVASSDMGGCRAIMEMLCREAGFEPRVAFESDDYLTVQGLVAAGVGVAMIPSLGLAAYRPDVAIRSLVGANPKRDIFAATLPGGRRSPATQAMLDVLCDAAQRYDLGETRLAVAS